MTDDITDWTELREFRAINMTASFVLSWETEGESLLIDLDLLLCPEHAFYEEPRPAEKACFRAALLEFPACGSIRVNGVRDDSQALADVTATLGHGAISGMRRIGNGVYEISGDFGRIEISGGRPILRLKGSRA